MTYQEIVNQLTQQDGIEESTIMKSPCLRYQGDFVAMMFEPEESLIVKLSAARVNEIIDASEGSEFNFTSKKFKEWVMIPLDFEDKFMGYVLEAIAYAESK